MESPAKLKLPPELVKIAPPGDEVIVQFPEVGSPLNSTEPNALLQVGCAINPTIGAVGLYTLIVAFPEDVDEHNVVLSVTMKE